MPAFVIRRAGLDDVDAVTAVHDAGRRAYYAAGGVGVGPPDPQRRVTWENLITGPDRSGWLAERDGAVLGVMAAGRPVHHVGTHDPVLELIALFVTPAAWGSGVGAALHVTFVTELDSGPWRAGVLEVWARNDRARNFYARRGWRPDGRSRPGEGGAPYLSLALQPGGQVRSG